MVYRPSVDPSLAFVLMPFRPPFDSYYDEIIKPAAKAAGLEVRKADEIYGTGPIIHDIWNQIWAASVVIADVTQKNPNVNYELGICHALGVPTVIITQDFADVPFDYQHRRCIKYDTKEVDWQRKLRKAISATLKKVVSGEDVSLELSWPYETAPSRKEHKDASLLPAAEGRDIVIRGVQLVRDPIALAFGPRGSHISLSAGAHEQVYYRQGAKIAKAISSAQRLEQIGINHTNALGSEMLSKVGDGSKTAILIFQKMLEVGNQALKRGYSHSDVLHGMARATEAALAAIQGQSRPLKRNSVIQVARTAAGGNDQVAQIVITAFSKVGRDGIVVVQHGSSRETILELQEGMNFDRGYIDEAFLKPTEIRECVLEDSYVLISEQKISSMRDMLPILEQVVEARRPLLVIAEDVEGEALATLLVNRKKGTLDCLAVKAPGYADTRRAILQDIAVLTGGSTITRSSGRTLAGLSINDLGRAKKIIVTKNETTILGGAGESDINKHMEAIREQLSRTTSAYDAEKLRERMARLGGAVASIRVGGTSEQDVIDNSYSAESAMYSVQTALEEGVVTGGGVSLFRAREALKRLDFKKPGEIAGVAAVADAVEEPVKQLLVGNRIDGSGVLRKLKRAKNAGIGFNVETGKVEDLDAAGVIDPVATITHAVRLAYSHARPLLATAAWESTVPIQDPLVARADETQLQETGPMPTDRESR